MQFQSNTSRKKCTTERTLKQRQCSCNAYEKHRSFERASYELQYCNKLLTSSQYRTSRHSSSRAVSTDIDRNNVASMLQQCCITTADQTKHNDPNILLFQSRQRTFLPFFQENMLHKSQKSKTDSSRKPGWQY